MAKSKDIANALKIEKHVEAKKYWEAVAKCKEDFVLRGIDPRNNPVVRPEVAEGWIFAKSHGVLPEDSYDQYILDEKDLQEVREKNKLLYNTARPLLEIYERMALSSGFSLELFDPTGCVIMGSHIPLPQSADKKIPGVRLDIKKTGLFAHNLAIKYKKPFYFIGPEVYLNLFKNVLSFAAPILDETNNTIGALVFWRYSGEKPWADMSARELTHTMGWVHTLAVAIEKNVHLTKLNHLTMTTLELIDEAIVTVDKTGQILSANSKGKKLFNMKNSISAGVNVFDHLSESSIIVKALLNGEKKDFKEEILSVNNRQEIYSVSVNPVIENKDYGLDLSVLRFIPQAKITNMIAKNIGSNAAFTFKDIVGKSKLIMEAKQAGKRFAQSGENILLLGESGTGKELFAQAIHNQSCPSGPFIALNCAIMPRNIIESELFGYEGGTFTGAEKNGKPGKIELANGGTLFLDEIGEMPYELQAMLLRVLQNKEVLRLGGQHYRKVDFRLIAATNQDLTKMLAARTFREDLYFRLSVLSLEIPPLRFREKDIILLAEYFMENYAQKTNRPVPRLSAKAIDKLLKFPWPGNVRQLENAIIYAMNMCDDKIIDVHHFPKDILLEIATFKNATAFSSIKNLEEHLLLETYERTKSVTKTARILGISKTSVYRKLKSAAKD